MSIAALGPLFWSSIEYIDLSGTSVTGRGISAIFRQCNDMVDINVSGCIGVNDDVMIDIIRASPRLTCINVANTRCSNNTMVALTNNCPKLMEVDFAYTAANDAAVQYMTAARGAQMRKFVVPTGVTDDGLAAATCMMPELQELRIVGAPISDRGLETAIRPLRNLLALHLVDLNNVTDVGLKAISKLMPDLESFALHRPSILVTESGASHIFRQCRMLESVSLHHSRRFGDMTLDCLAFNLPYLMILDLRGMHDISGETLISVTHRAQSLRSVQVADCHEIKPHHVLAASAMASSRSRVHPVFDDDDNSSQQSDEHRHDDDDNSSQQSDEHHEHNDEHDEADLEGAAEVKEEEEERAAVAPQQTVVVQIKQEVENNSLPDADVLVPVGNNNNAGPADGDEEYSLDEEADIVAQSGNHNPAPPADDDEEYSLDDDTDIAAPAPQSPPASPPASHSGSRRRQRDDDDEEEHDRRPARRARLSIDPVLVVYYG